MKEIGDLFGEMGNKYTEQKKKNIGERHLIVGEIAEKLRVSSFKKISLPQLGILLSVYKTEEELYALHSRCKEAKNYAALFWYYVKPKNG